MRLIDADALLKGHEDHEMISTHLIWNAPTIDAVSVVHGEWKEREKFHNADDNPIIEEWQSARCSVCGKYHTTPYTYYFDKYNFCPNCGAKMDGERKTND